MDDYLKIGETEYVKIDEVSYPNGGKSSFYACKASKTYGESTLFIVDEGICDANAEMNDNVDVTESLSDARICDSSADNPAALCTGKAAGDAQTGRKNMIFPYSLITDMQNRYMAKYKHVYRFLSDDFGEIVKAMDEKNGSMDRGSKGTFTLAEEVIGEELKYHAVANRQDMGEVSPLEFQFEKSFSEVYGQNAVKYLEREHPLVDSEGGNYFLDYFVNTENGPIAVEENGVTYHHPQIIGPERYRRQLKKQNTCTENNIKLFRFSSEDCQFDGRIEDDIRRYFGRREHFIPAGIKVSRKVTLYEHQVEYLKAIKESREAGSSAFLVVLPTASGKSKIVETDLQDYFRQKPDARVLIMAPNLRIMDDWRQRIAESLPGYQAQITICSYMYMVRHYLEFEPEYFGYIAADEAHHAVASAIQRVIQHFNPEFLIGLTATDERPDKKRLETIFGEYKTQLTLAEAMEKGIVAKARAYRIETNLDLSEVRFNGKDYVNADLEKKIRVTSRNELIADVLKTYFAGGASADLQQGVVFCVNIKHAEEMARILNEVGLSARAVSSATKHADRVMAEFKDKKFRFLCSCNMISEGWDYPELEILVMARPTMSKVLYTQQMGRGLRRSVGKECVYVIDVVDEYGSMVSPCSMHSVFANPYYVPFGDITKSDYRVGGYVEVNGLVEQIQRIVEIDMESFDEKYGEYLSVEQLARKCYVNTGTVNSWITKGKINPTVSFPFGNKRLHMFSPEGVQNVMTTMNCREHGDDTIVQDFKDFIDTGDYTFSYKMPFMLSFLKRMNKIGEAAIDDILDDYIEFYQKRIDAELPVDRGNCPYNAETLANRKYMQRSMLTNPFEKFERKRFLYYSKELGMMAMNPVLLDKMTSADILGVENKLLVDLKEYYRELSGEY